MNLKKSRPWSTDAESVWNDIWKAGAILKDVAKRLDKMGYKQHARESYKLQRTIDEFFHKVSSETE